MLEEARNHLFAWLRVHSLSPAMPGHVSDSDILTYLYSNVKEIARVQAVFYCTFIVH